MIEKKRARMLEMTLESSIVDVRRVCICAELSNKVNEVRFINKGDQSRLQVIGLK